MWLVNFITWPIRAIIRLFVADAVHSEVEGKALEVIDEALPEKVKKEPKSLFGQIFRLVVWAVGISLFFHVSEFILTGMWHPIGNTIMLILPLGALVEIPPFILRDKLGLRWYIRWIIYLVIWGLVIGLWVVPYVMDTIYRIIEVF